MKALQQLLQNMNTRPLRLSPESFVLNIFDFETSKVLHTKINKLEKLSNKAKLSDFLLF